MFWSLAAHYAASSAQRRQFRSGEQLGETCGATGRGGRPDPRIAAAAVGVVSGCVQSSNADPWLTRAANRGGSGGDVCALDDPLELLFGSSGEGAGCNFRGLSGGGLLGSRKGTKATAGSGSVWGRSSHISVSCAWVDIARYDEGRAAAA